MNAYSLLLGARNSTASGTRFTARDERRVQEITGRHFPGGFTILEASGGWFDPDSRRFVHEPSRQILITARRISEVRCWAQELGAALAQKELMVVCHGRVLRLNVHAARKVVRRR